MDMFLKFGWRSSPGVRDLETSPLEHARNQTSFQDVVVSKRDRSTVVKVSADADTDWETMPIPPDYERVPKAGVVAGSPDTGGKTMPIPPDYDRVPNSYRCRSGDNIDPTRSRTHIRHRRCRWCSWP